MVKQAAIIWQFKINSLPLQRKRGNDLSNTPLNAENIKKISSLTFDRQAIDNRENSSVGRAQPCQGWGRGFESRFSLKTLAFSQQEMHHPNVRVVELVDTLL